MRLERTLVRREIREFIIDLNSSRNLRSEISLLFVGVGIELGWLLPLTFAYEREIGEFSVAGC